MAPASPSDNLTNTPQSPIASDNDTAAGTTTPMGNMPNSVNIVDANDNNSLDENESTSTTNTTSTPPIKAPAFKPLPSNSSDDTLSKGFPSSVSLVPAGDAEISGRDPDEIVEESKKREKKRKKRRRIMLPFEGMLRDLKRKIPWIPSDYYQGIHPKVIAAVVFMFFASVAPALSFGIFLNSQTNGELGVTEVLFSTAISGIFYSLFAGVGLCILGVTGPVSIFSVTIYTLADIMGIPFLPWLSVISYWSALMHFLLAIFNATVLIKYVTRFTLETFGMLISIIYIVNAFKELYDFFANDTVSAALLTTLFAFGTAILAYMLHRSRGWHVLPAFSKKLLSDCAVPISIAVFTGLMYIPVVHKVDVPYLPVPETFRPTPDRSWWIYSQYNQLPVWSIFFAIVPAFILTALFFFDHNVSSMLAQQAEFNLKKGSAYHWDFFVLGITMAICATLGLPPCNSLIPQAPLHVRALATIKHEKDPESGRVVEKFVSVRENRISNLAHATLIGIMSIFGQVILRLVPVSTMTGLFLFMGASSFDGNQFYSRVKLLFVCSGDRRRLYHKHLPLVKHVHPVKQVLYTLIQVFCAALIYAVTETPAGIIFPLLILVLVPVRLVGMRLIFSKADLYYLDNSKSDIEPLLPTVAEEVEREEEEERRRKSITRSRSSSVSRRRSHDGSSSNERIDQIELNDVKLNKILKPEQERKGQDRLDTVSQNDSIASDAEDVELNVQQEEQEESETAQLPIYGLRSEDTEGASDDESDEEEVSMSTWSASAMLPHASRTSTDYDIERKKQHQKRELKEESFSNIMKEESDSDEEQEDDNDESV